MDRNDPLFDVRLRRRAHDFATGKESVVHADAGYTGPGKHTTHKGLDWQTARKRGSVKALPEGREKRAIEKEEKRKASIRARVEHPFRVLKCQFGYVKVRFKGLAKNTGQILTFTTTTSMLRK